jgi:hypothetical protein
MWDEYIDIMPIKEDIYVLTETDFSKYNEFLKSNDNLTEEEIVEFCEQTFKKMPKEFNHDGVDYLEYITKPIIEELLENDYKYYINYEIIEDKAEPSPLNEFLTGEFAWQPAIIYFKNGNYMIAVFDDVREIEIIDYTTLKNDAYGIEYIALIKEYDFHVFALIYDSNYQGSLYEIEIIDSINEFIDSIKYKSNDEVSSKRSEKIYKIFKQLAKKNNLIDEFPELEN